MKRLGLKVYSTDARRIKTIERMFAQRLFDYIELYAVPGTFRATAAAWRSVHIPYIVHVAHTSYDFNLARRTHARNNSRIFAEARRFADMLDAAYLICHPGVQGSSGETIRQLRSFADGRVLIENKPVISLDGKLCVGYSPDEIRMIKDGARCGFCFDIAHCAKYCYTGGHDLFGEIDRFMKMRPSVIHLCDGFKAGCFDEHLAFGSGDFPLDKFCKRIRASSTVSHITVETPKRIRQWESDVKCDFSFIARQLSMRSA
jgi:sugar phosphate isomerase/epimerase